MLQGQNKDTGFFKKIVETEKKSQKTLKKTKDFKILKKIPFKKVKQKCFTVFVVKF